jgi:reticulon-4-interacting protein 1, mitochondrial
MRAVQHDGYGPAREVLRVIDDARQPEPGEAELLVRVHASSVNPIDCAVRSGYGRDFFEARTGQRPPIRPGRDVAGEIIAMGAGVRGFCVGDAIYAAMLGGANAEFAVVPAAWAAPKPRSLSFEQAASLPFVALTAWTALVTHAGLTPENTAGKNVIVPRAAGGVGSFAVQLVKAWGGYVAGICSTRNVALVMSLGAGLVIDYTRDDPARQLHDFDIAFDTSFDTEAMLLAALKVNADAAYVSIVTPKFRLIDEYGVEEGLRKAEALFAERVRTQAELGRRYYWSFTEMTGDVLRTIGELIERGRIRPVIDRTYALDRIVEAHEYSESRQAQGKIVIGIASA